MLQRHVSHIHSCEMLLVLHGPGQASAHLARRRRRTDLRFALHELRQQAQADGERLAGPRSSALWLPRLAHTHPTCDSRSCAARLVLARIASVSAGRPPPGAGTLLAFCQGSRGKTRHRAHPSPGVAQPVVDHRFPFTKYTSLATAVALTCQHPWHPRPHGHPCVPA